MASCSEASSDADERKGKVAINYAHLYTYVARPILLFKYVAVLAKYIYRRIGCADTQFR